MDLYLLLALIAYAQTEVFLGKLDTDCSTLIKLLLKRHVVVISCLYNEYNDCSIAKVRKCRHGEFADPI